MRIALPELTRLLGVALPSGKENDAVTGFGSLGDAREGELSFYCDHRYKMQLESTRASVVLAPPGTELPPGVMGIEVESPAKAFEKVVQVYGWQPTPPVLGIHPTAVVPGESVAGSTGVSIGANVVVETGVVIGNDVTIGAGCYLGHGVRVGEGTRLYPGVTVLESCVIGRNVVLHPKVVIGADGFGYEFVQGRHQKVRQTGMVQIDDDVEIGAGTTIDRARFGRTWIGQGTKIDNQVQIGHNVVVGRHCVIVAMVGLCGSAQLGDYVVMGGQSGVVEHVKIGTGCSIAARTVVMKDLPPGRQAYMGFPATPVREERRRMAAARRLPDLMEAVKVLQREVEALKRTREEDAGTTEA